MKNGFQKILKTEDGYHICNDCNGTGINKNQPNIPCWLKDDECRICGGEGVIDWITFIRVGAK